MDSFADLKLNTLIDGKTATVSFDQLDYYTLYRLFKHLQDVFGDGELLYEQLYDTELSYFKRKLRYGVLERLNKNGIVTLGQLFDLSEQQLVNLEGIGPRSKHEIFTLLTTIFNNN